MTAERTNITYTETEDGELVIPEIVPVPSPSLPKPWPKPPEPEKPAPDKED
jgi:hypothetical protein